MDRAASKRRAARRRSKVAAARPVLADQLPWCQPAYLDRPVEPVDSDGITRIHDASMRIIEDMGILFLNDTALQILAEAGCRVDFATKNVRMDRGWVMEQVKKAPPVITITPRNPDRAITFGGRYFNFGQVASPPNVTDLDHGRRMGTREDCRNFFKLAQSYNCIHFSCGYPVEPMDLHPSTRHLDTLYDKLVLTDKVVHAYSLGPDRIADAMEMVRLAGGLSSAEFEAQPRMFTNINSTSPLKHDWPMLDGAMRMAARNQMVVVAPFTLAGAMAPVTIVGAIVQQNAEALAAIALLQTVRAGAPVMYGAFTSNVDMKSGAPAFGTPEYIRAMQISGQMARYYNLPFRASNANAAQAPDAQAVWETAFSLFGSCSGGANLIYHAAGWLEGGLVASFKKLLSTVRCYSRLSMHSAPWLLMMRRLRLVRLKRSGPMVIFSGLTTPKSGIVMRFMHRYYRIGATMSRGMRPVRSGLISGLIQNLRPFLPNMKPRHWMSRRMTP